MPTCAECGGSLPDDADACDACGAPVAATWAEVSPPSLGAPASAAEPPSAVEPPGPVPGPVLAPAGDVAVRPLNITAGVVLVLAVLTAATEAWRAVTHLQLVAYVQAVQSGHRVASLASGLSADHHVTVAATVNRFATLAFAISVIVWTRRIVTAVSSARPGAMRYTPGQAVGMWFVPVLNLIRPAQIIANAWSASGDEPDPAPAPALIPLWWASWLLGGTVLVVVTLVIGVNPSQVVLRQRTFAIGSTIAAVASCLTVAVVAALTARVRALAARPGVAALDVAAMPPPSVAPPSVPPRSIDPPSVAPPSAPLPFVPAPSMPPPASVPAFGPPASPPALPAASTPAAAEWPLPTAPWPDVTPGPAPATPASPSSFGRRPALWAGAALAVAAAVAIIVAVAVPVAGPSPLDAAGNLAGEPVHATSLPWAQLLPPTPAGWQSMPPDIELTLDRLSGLFAKAALVRADLTGDGYRRGVERGEYVQAPRQVASIEIWQFATPIGAKQFYDLWTAGNSPGQGSEFSRTFVISAPVAADGYASDSVDSSNFHYAIGVSRIGDLIVHVRVAAADPVPDALVATVLTGAIASVEAAPSSPSRN